MAEDNPQQLIINKLPDEILLTIFRKLSTNEFVMVLPLVCTRWAKVVASDVCTLKSVVMHHCNTDELFFVPTKDEDFINWPAEKFEIILNSSLKGSHPLIEYSNAFFICLEYIRIYKHIKTLMISQNVSIIPSIDNVLNLTTLVFYGVSFYQKNVYPLSELGRVYVNISDVLYINCRLFYATELDFLHAGFKKLKNIRVDHSNMSDTFLDELLETHHTLESVKLGYCTIMSDRWIDVLLDRLKGKRFIASLDMCSPYFTKSCVNKFLETNDLFLDKKLIKIQFDSALHPFFISIV